MNVRTPVTLLVLLGALLGAAYYGWQTVVTPDDSDEPPKATGPVCTEVVKYRKGEVIRSRDIVVNVYNAGTLTGLAAETMDTLHDKGFRRGVVANAPGTVETRQVLIMTKSPRSPEVKLVARQFHGKVTIRAGRDLGAGIDVVLGDGFKSVDRNADTKVKLKRPVKACEKTKPRGQT